MNRDPKPLGLFKLVILALTAALLAVAVVGETATLLRRRRPAPAPAAAPPVVVDGPTGPIIYRDTWCPPPSMREDPEPKLDLPPEEHAMVIQTELHAFARLVQLMREKQRSNKRADIADAEAFEREVDARCREILGQPAVATPAPEPVEEGGAR